MPEKQAFHPAGAVTAGPYTPAVAVDDLVMISGQGPISSETKDVAGDTFEEQVELTFENVERVLQGAGCTLDDCIKVNVYLSDMAHFERFNAIYKTKFSEPFPTRTTVQVVMWHHIQIEIDVMAIRGCGSKG